MPRYTMHSYILRIVQFVASYSIRYQLSVSCLSVLTAIFTGAPGLASYIYIT